jgi:16S rRNA A1518/A1519 N6-dimethyltransferase RsmA/KsgA/DIM1 with predicted DNA glycosylase/AP lyase activity
MLRRSGLRRNNAPVSEYSLGRARIVAGERIEQPRLRCPGGPRLSYADIRSVYSTPRTSTLAKDDLRFIMNLKLTHELLRHFNASPATDKLFVEVGPGPGMLTRSLLTRPCIGVFGIELDQRFNSAMESVQQGSGGKFKWSNANILQVDEATLVEQEYPQFVSQFAAAAQRQQTPREVSDRRKEARQRRRAGAEKSNGADDGGGLADDASSPFESADAASAHSSLWRSGDPKLELIANLPFRVASNIAMRYAVDCSRRENVFKFGRVPVHLFFQKEVAERLVALPGTKEYGRLAVLMQNYFRVSVKSTFVERTYFPPTEVLGALVTLEPRSVPLVDVDGAALLNFLDIVMDKRRRMTTVLQGLKRCVPMEVALYILREVRVDGELLPTQITVSEVAAMALLWVRFLEASHQEFGSGAGDGAEDFAAPAPGPGGEAAGRQQKRSYEHVKSHLDHETAAEFSDMAAGRGTAQKRFW